MIHEQGSDSDSSPPEAPFETPPPLETSSPDSPSEKAAPLAPHLKVMLRVGEEKLP